MEKMAFTATYTTWVVSNLNNTFCVGCLDFLCQLTDNGPDARDNLMDITSQVSW